MTRLAIIGPCSGVLAAEVVGATGNVSISSLETRPHGVYSIRMNPVAGVAGARFQVQQGTDINNATALVPWSQASVYLDYYFVIKEDPSATLQMAVITKTGGAAQVGWDINTSRQAQLWYMNGSGVKTNIGSLSAAMPRNVIHRITLVGTALATGGSSTAFLRLNGATVAQASALTVTAAPANSGEVFFGTTATTGCDYYLTDIRVDNAEVPGGTNGSMIVFTRMKSLATGLFAVQGTTDATEAVKDDVAPETTKYIYTSSAPHDQRYNMRPFARWFGAGTVHAVKLHVQASETGGTTSNVSLRMRQNAVNADSAGHTALAAAWSWLGYLRTTAPDGTAWTLSKLDNTEVGVLVNSLTATTVAFATIYVYAEVTPDDGLWLFVDWYRRFHAGAREWPQDWEAFSFGGTAGSIPVDVTNYFTRLSIRRGRARSTDAIAPGRASFTLLNTTDDGSGDPLFNVGTTASGGLDSRLGQLGHRVRIVAARNGNLHGLFYGYTSSIRQSNIPGQTPRVDIEAVDGLEWMRTRQVAFTGTSISLALGLDGPSSPGLGYALGFKDTTIAPLWRIANTTDWFSRMWFKGDAATGARMAAYEAADNGWWFMDPDGRYYYRGEDWHGRNESLGTVPVASADVQLRDQEPYAGAEVQIAYQKSVTLPSAPPYEVVWSHGAVPIPIAAGETLIAVADFTRPITAYFTPFGGTDYIANTAADGSGTNITANIVATEERWWIGGLIAKLKNNGASAGFITTWQIRGQTAIDLTHDRTYQAGSEPFKPALYEFMDTASIGAAKATALSNKVTDTTPQPRTTVTVIPSGAAAEELLLKLDLARKANFQNTANPALGGPIPLNAVRTVQGLTWEFVPGAPWRATYEIE